MKTLLIFAILLSGGAAIAQTGLIAHKSHSGTAETFALADPGNFGRPSEPLTLEKKLKKVTWLNDTTVVMSGRMIYEYFLEEYQMPHDTLLADKPAYNDTIYNHPLFSDLNMPLDTLKKTYVGVEFENFDKKEVKTPPTPKQSSREKRKNKASKTDDSPEIRTSKKRKSSFLWLWLVGSGTFAGILLVSGKRKPAVANAG